MKKLILGTTAAVAGLSVAAASYDFSYDTVFTGQNPGGPAPWVTGTLTDVGAGRVLITFDSQGLKAGEFVRQVRFNLDPTVTSVTLDSFAGSVYSATTSYRQNGFNDAGFRYDLNLEFTSANSKDRFTDHETISVLVSGPGLDASDFLQPSIKNGNGGEGPYSLMHIQGLLGGDSSTVTLSRPFTPTASDPNPVPEASSWISMLGLAGGAGLALQRRARSRRAGEFGYRTIRG